MISVKSLETIVESDQQSADQDPHVFWQNPTLVCPEPSLPTAES